MMKGTHSIKLKTQPHHSHQKENCEQATLTKRRSLLPAEDGQTLLMRKIREVVRSNVDYFQSKVKVANCAKPYEGKLKMDIKTGATTYQYDYLHSAPDSYSTYNNLPANLTNTHHSPRKLAYIISNLQKSPLLNQNLQDNIDLKVNDRALIDTVTNYQKAFGRKKQSDSKRSSKQLDGISAEKVKQRKNKQKKNIRLQEEIPHLLSTQNKCDFLNWGGKNAVIPIIPPYNPSVTHLPFTHESLYQTEFVARSPAKKQPIIYEDSFPRAADISLYKQSLYGKDFARGHQRVLKEQRNTSDLSSRRDMSQTAKNPNLRTINFKVKDDPPIQFKDIPKTTEYGGEFKSKPIKMDCFDWKDKSVKELENIVINL